MADETTAPDQQQEQSGPTAPPSWADAAESSSAPQPAQPQQSSVPVQSSSSSDTIPNQPMPDAPPPDPVVITPQKRGGILGVIDGIADALTGRTRPELATDQHGNAYVKQNTLTRGQHWMRIAQEGLTGAAAGLAAGKGAGNGGAAAFAGVQQGQKIAAQQKQDDQDLTAEARQQNLDNANNQMLRMKMAEQAWRATRLQVEASQHDTEFAQGQVDRLVKEGGTVLGSAAHPGDISDILKVNPDVMKDMIQKHQIEIMPKINEDGTRGGITVVKMPDGYRKTILPAGTTFHTFNETTGQYDEHRSADPMTAGERDDLEHGAGAASLKFQSDKKEQDLKTAQTNDAIARAKVIPSEINKNNAEAGKASAEGAKARAETQNLNTSTDAATIQSNGKQLVEGTADPSNLSKRSKSYDSTIAAANSYSLATTGQPFDIAKAVHDYKAANDQGTVNKLNLLNSLTGRDNQSGNLETIVQLSKTLGQTQFPPLNKVEQWAKLSAGNPKVAAYRGALLETSEQLGNILQGGGNSTSDTKLKAAAGVLDKNFNAQQMAETATTMRELLANRKSEIIGDNRYLNRWHGHPQAGGQVMPNGGGSNVQVQPGEPTARGAKGETLVVRNGAWVAAQQ